MFDVHSLAAGTANVELTHAEFLKIQQLTLSITGIYLSDAKKSLICGRLYKRLRHYGMKSYGEYLLMLASDRQELTTAVDLLTTNETHFFREPKHFTWMQQSLLPTLSYPKRIRIWSAAASTGQEAYSLAMLLHDNLGENGWEVFGSDVSSQVLNTAKQGLYPISLADEIPENYLKAYCLKGVGKHEGLMKISPTLMNKVSFDQINLNKELPNVGMFDVIFLRNILIYFQQDTKQSVVARILKTLKPGGHLIIGHSETLHGMFSSLKSIAPSIYQKIS
jgi:chemotaxis protein methyltransferase CheR